MNENSFKISFKKQHPFSIHKGYILHPMIFKENRMNSLFEYMCFSLLKET